MYLLSSQDIAEKAVELGHAAEEAVAEKSPERLETVIQQLINWSLEAGRHILLAIIVYVIGHYVIKFIKHLLNGMMERRNVNITIQSFVKSFVNIVLQVLLIISIVGALGINTTSFAALLASAGVAVGMALSGNLQNFAGGIIILLFKPYKIGDWVEAQGTSGNVKEIQIFHTILETADGKMIYIPNGAMSSGLITNITMTPTRRIEWVVGVEYGQDMDLVRKVCSSLIEEDARIMKEPAPLVYLTELADSSVNVLIRAWVTNEDYWDVLFDFRERLYKRFNSEGIAFPFPQVTIHQGS
ncbi:MAG: mechanosensitive ion channel [Bacteroidaceae bacterium]|nr:mechanosensitive ion channel [Bacteroidaceae bacterium]